MGFLNSQPVPLMDLMTASRAKAVIKTFRTRSYRQPQRLLALFGVLFGLFCILITLWSDQLLAARVSASSSQMG